MNNFWSIALTAPGVVMQFIQAAHASDAMKPGMFAQAVVSAYQMILPLLPPGSPGIELAKMLAAKYVPLVAADIAAETAGK